MQFHHNRNLNSDYMPQTIQSYQFSKRNTLYPALDFPRSLGLPTKEFFNPCRMLPDDTCLTAFVIL